jgi:hypothetical protein
VHGTHTRARARTRTHTQESALVVDLADALKPEDIAAIQTEALQLRAAAKAHRGAMLIATAANEGSPWTRAQPERVVVRRLAALAARALELLRRLMDAELVSESAAPSALADDAAEWMRLFRTPVAEYDALLVLDGARARGPPVSEFKNVRKGLMAGLDMLAEFVGLLEARFGHYALFFRCGGAGVGGRVVVGVVWRPATRASAPFKVGSAAFAMPVGSAGDKMLVPDTAALLHEMTLVGHGLVKEVEQPKVASASG